LGKSCTSSSTSTPPVLFMTTACMLLRLMVVVCLHSTHNARAHVPAALACTCAAPDRVRSQTGHSSARASLLSTRDVHSVLKRLILLVHCRLFQLRARLKCWQQEQLLLPHAAPTATAWSSRVRLLQHNVNSTSR
jgi:hypothetical protein